MSGYCAVWLSEAVEPSSVVDELINKVDLDFENWRTKEGEHYSKAVATLCFYGGRLSPATGGKLFEIGISDYEGEVVVAVQQR